MKIKGIVWLGTRTSDFDGMVNFYQNIMGLDVTHQEPGFVVMDLPNGDRVEVFGEESSYNMFFSNPVAGFLVDDIAAARAEMESHGIEFIGPTEVVEDGYAWAHFRAPDGFIYELTYDPKRSLQ
jgi:catechol 2,3-dioxygenase-like lactoylglutathione lyase family enzyme